MSAHALVVLAWRLEKVSLKFATPSNSVFRDVSGHSGVPGCSGVPVFRGVPGVPVFRSVPVFRCSGVPRFSTCHSISLLQRIILSACPGAVPVCGGEVEVRGGDYICQVSKRYGGRGAKVRYIVIH